MSKKIKFKKEKPNEDGWSDWVHPLNNYMMACCDCGLVHDLEFRIDRDNKLNFRARRNIKQTKRLRKKNER